MGNRVVFDLRPCLSASQMLFFIVIISIMHAIDFITFLFYLLAGPCDLFYYACCNPKHVLCTCTVRESFSCGSLIFIWSLNIYCNNLVCSSFSIFVPKWL